MKKIILIFSLFLIISCNNSVTVSAGSNNTGVTEEYKLKFEQQIEAWETFTNGFNKEDMDLTMSVISDTVMWSPPNYNGNKILGYNEFKDAVQGYFTNFDEIVFKPGEGLIGSDDAYWSGSLYSSGETNPEPNVMRIYGTWYTKHTETGAPANNKWYGVLNFNKDNKIASFSDWMDVNGMQVQIEQFLESSKN